MKILLILLAILKILAIVLLFLIGAFIIISSLILLIPIKYSITAEKGIRLYANLEIKWLIKTIYFKYRINTEYKKVLFKVFGKTIYKDKVIFEDKLKDKEDEYKKEDEVNFSQTTNHKYKENLEEDSEVKGRKIPKEKEINTEEKEIDNQIENIIKDEAEKFEHIAEEEIKENSVIEKIEELWNYPHRQEIVNALIKLTKRVLKVLFPKKLNLNIEFGCDNPATTGYILALSSILTLYFGNTIKVYGNFEKSVLNGSFKAEGKFVLFRIVYALLAFIVIKPVRKIIWNYLKNRRKEE